jgi:hypothetical protein
MTPSLIIRGLAIAAALMVARPAASQSIEPRAFSPAPTGVNFLIVGYAATQGGLSFDPAIPVTDAKIDSTGPILAYARSLDILGRSGKIDVIVPAGRLHGSAVFQGQPVARTVDGVADPLVRLSVALYGAPALTPAEFRNYRADLVVGASVQVSVPVGQYDTDRLLNIGTHRWQVKPEVGVSKALGPWTLELTGAVTLFGDNDDFFGGVTRSQRPLWSGQSHLVYSFRSGAWAAFDATYFTGGQTRLGEVLQNDLQENWRLGGTLALPVDRRKSLKFKASSGVSARTGNNFDQVAVAWQHRWGGGL